MKPDFGFLTVKAQANRPPGSTQRCLFWLCECVCGTRIVARGTALRSGHTTSCGCDGVDRTPRDNGDGSFSIAAAGGHMILVDAIDLPLVTKYRWRAKKSQHGKTFYAITGTGRNRQYLHRLLGVGEKLTDHKNGNGLDNRRCNLRDATPSQNGGNSGKKRKITSSRFKGVCLHKQTGKWVARAAGEHLGLFSSEVAAARAYDAAAKKRWGEFAKLNFPS